MSQCVCAKGSLGQGIEQPEAGGFLGSKQIYLGFPELTPNELDHLGMESPFSGEGELL